MYRIDYYKKNPKNPKKSIKMGSAWYETLEEAENAAYALSSKPKTYTYVPREGAQEVTRTLWGFTCSKPVQDLKY